MNAHRCQPDRPHQLGELEVYLCECGLALVPYADLMRLTQQSRKERSARRWFTRASDLGRWRDGLQAGPSPT